jgi:hypothetical protein
MGAARDERDVGALRRQPTTEIPTDATRAKNGNTHGGDLSSPSTTSAGAMSNAQWLPEAPGRRPQLPIARRQ